MSNNKNIVKPSVKRGRTGLKPYPLDFRESAIKMALESSEPLAHTARNLGINENTLYNWVGLYQKKKSANYSSGSKSRNTPSYAEENRNLREQLKKVTQERDLLKKAAAYFAKESQ